MTETVYTEDTSSGRIHKRLRDSSDRLLVDERCNLDEAGAHRVLTEGEYRQAATDDPERLCRHCFPASAADGDVETTGG